MSIIPISDRQSSSSSNNNLLSFPLDIWDPFKNFHGGPLSSLTLQNPLPEFPFFSPISNLYLELFGGGRVSGRIDWQETATAYVVKGYLPGLNRDQITIEVEGDGRVLKISGAGGKFLTSFAVPDDALIDYLDASMGNGLLIVTVPKQAALAAEPTTRPSVRSIEISE